MESYYGRECFRQQMVYDYAKHNPYYNNPYDEEPYNPDQYEYCDEMPREDPFAGFYQNKNNFGTYRESKVVIASDDDADDEDDDISDITDDENNHPIDITNNADINFDNLSNKPIITIEVVKEEKMKKSIFLNN